MFLIFIGSDRFDLITKTRVVCLWEIPDCATVRRHVMLRPTITVRYHRYECVVLNDDAQTIWAQRRSKPVATRTIFQIEFRGFFVYDSLKCAATLKHKTFLIYAFLNIQHLLPKSYYRFIIDEIPTLFSNESSWICFNKSREIDFSKL